MKTRKIIRAVLMLVIVANWLTILGVVGGMEQNTIPLINGMIGEAIAFAVLIGNTYALSKVWED